MGRTYLFQCPHCGYAAKVSGGADKGFRFTNQTVLCLDCKQLHDVVTGLKSAVTPVLSEPLTRKGLKSLIAVRRKVPAHPPLFAAALSFLPPTGSRHFKWLKFKPACPVSALHRVRVWNQPDRCPKCGVLMEINALPFRIWD